MPYGLSSALRGHQFFYQRTDRRVAELTPAHCPIGNLPVRHTEGLLPSTANAYSRPKTVSRGDSSTPLAPSAAGLQLALMRQFHDQRFVDRGAEHFQLLDSCHSVFPFHFAFGVESSTPLEPCAASVPAEVGLPLSIHSKATPISAPKTGPAT
jgi:hypothetical protein